MARVYFPLPNTDFDVTESAVPWKLLTRAGHSVTFGTPDGGPAGCDPLTLNGVLFGQLGAFAEPCTFYREMAESSEFRAPLAYDAVDISAFDAVWYSGGHAQGMKPYLESELLQQQTREFWAIGKPIAAICHGVIVLARSGVLAGVKTTCLPKYMELCAWSITAWKLGNYYRTYPETVQDEIIRRGGLFQRDPFTLFSRGTEADDSAAFVVEDGHYLSGRWPGDAYLLARKLIGRLPPA